MKVEGPFYLPTDLSTSEEGYSDLEKLHLVREQMLLEVALKAELRIDGRCQSLVICLGDEEYVVPLSEKDREALVSWDQAKAVLTQLQYDAAAIEVRAQRRGRKGKKV